ncbi:5,10-methylene-tetrahydrofolate dehydrogenase/methenyl tetrahydrofolate cyclohydrolase/folate-dependent phosphoribosylglycinamide formyltransferase PurN [Bradyrhizobium sp. USDA 4502]
MRCQSKDNKPKAEAQLIELVDQTGTELIVLARYMQVLSDGLCKRMAGKIINTHHSFLPSFKGASPYRQAYQRGVKLIGATAHYVTADLDEGPIIEQDIVRITHAQSPDDYVSLGRDVESQVLARAIHAHIHHRTFINGSRTVVFPAGPGSYASDRVVDAMANIINGKSVAASVIDAVKADAARLVTEAGIMPGLAVIIVGDDPASHAYVGAKSRMAKECGFHSVQHTLPAETSQQELADLVASLNSDSTIHGILVQLPLPKPLQSDPIIQAIRPEKDVDGLHVVNAGKLAVGNLQTGLISCTPAGAMLLIRSVHGDDLSGLNAIVIGRSNLFGKPMGQLLLNANATVVMAHSRTSQLAAMTGTADIVVAAVGRAEMVKADWIKPGATVIDVGINRIPAPEKGHGKNKLVGDVAFQEVAQIAGAITPVPGGVGPMTIAMLMANTVIAAARSGGLSPLKL